MSYPQSKQHEPQHNVTLLRIIQAAARDRQRHLRVGKPMVFSEGFKEANIAHDLSWSFRKAGFYVFPEFRYAGGSIDALFVRDNIMVLAEWKRLHPRSTIGIVEQTKRMLKFSAGKELPQHGFKPRKWKVRYLWVCDAWDGECVDWWIGRRLLGQPRSPFAKWNTGEFAFDSLGSDWSSYSWVWAIL